MSPLERAGPLRYASPDGRFVALATSNRTRTRGGAEITRITSWTLFDAGNARRLRKVHRDIPLAYARLIVRLEEERQDEAPDHGGPD